MAKLYERRQVKANRPHKCHLCGKIIPSGVCYIREKWKDDGFNEIKRHIHCDALLGEFFESNYYSMGDEYTDDEVWEWIRDKCLELCGSDGRWDCEHNPFSCERMIGSITNIASRNAAMESMRECKDSREGDQHHVFTDHVFLLRA